MIIMQTEDAKKRRKYIEEKGLGKVIWGYEKDSEGVVCVQYHPRGVKGMCACIRMMVIRSTLAFGLRPGGQSKRPKADDSNFQEA
jgi:hypothetical protein